MHASIKSIGGENPHLARDFLAKTPVGSVGSMIYVYQNIPKVTRNEDVNLDHRFITVREGFKGVFDFLT